jgi:hypothetical protein
LPRKRKLIKYKYQYSIESAMNKKWGSRKIQGIGDNFFVSIPRPWLRTQGLEQCDQVIIDMLGDGSLKISPIQGGV